jgi:hypothetical protein
MPQDAATTKEREMKWNQYLKADGTITNWREEPDSATDREIFSLSPLRRCWMVGEKMEHRSLGMIECIRCERVENEDQDGEWDGPSFIGDFVRT